jgi:hypothetical protein
MSFIANARVQARLRSHVKLSTVSIMGVEVGRAKNLLLLLVGEVSKEAGHILLDSCRVVTSEIDGLRKPAFVKVPGPLDCLRIGRGIGQWDLVAAVVLVGDRGVFSKNGLSQMVGFGVGEKNRLAAMEGLFLVGYCKVLEVLRWQRVLVAEDDCCRDQYKQIVGMPRPGN